VAKTGIFQTGGWDIDVVHLYEKYFERKLHSYVTEKERVDITHDKVLDSHELLKELFWEDLRSVL
jgi:hypothetical protein